MNAILSAGSQVVLTEWVRVIAFPLPGAARTADASSAALKAGMAAERLTQTQMQIKVRLAVQRLIMETGLLLDAHQLWSID